MEYEEVQIETGRITGKLINMQNSVKDGNANPLDVAIAIKEIETKLKQVKDDVQDEAIAEAEKYGNSFNYQNAKIEVASKSTYDYSNDEKYKEFKQKLKEREKLLKSIPENDNVADPETGEALQPPIKKTSTFLKIKV